MSEKEGSNSNSNSNSNNLNMQLTAKVDAVLGTELGLDVLEKFDIGIDGDGDDLAGELVHRGARGLDARSEDSLGDERGAILECKKGDGVS